MPQTVSSVQAAFADSSRSQTRAATIVLAVSAAGTLWMIAGWTGFIYIAMLLVLEVPGLALGFALFGRRHAAGWIAGLALGYVMTTMAWWAAIFSGHPTPLWLGAAWAVSAVSSLIISANRLGTPLVTLPAWTRRDSTALCLVLLMVPALVAWPFARLGSVDKQGNRLYRAYFLADFVWHTALAAELAKHEPRPRNPLMASQPVHYYWTYFRVPATLSAESGIAVETTLKLNAVATAFLFLSAIYLAAWAALPSWPFATAGGVALTVLGPSAEGLAAIVDLLRRGQPLAELRNLNIDAVASWAFKGIRIDNLPRAMWYTPQHAFSCAMGLLAVPIAIWGGFRAQATGIIAAGCLLGASLVFNPLLGAAFAAVYGSAMLADGVRQGSRPRDWARHSLAALPVAAALAWCTLNQVGDGASGVLHIGFTEPASNATLLNLLIQLGPILIPISLAVWLGSAAPFRMLWPAISGLVVGVLLMHFVMLTVNPAWVGFRGGQVFLVLAPAVVTGALAGLCQAGHRMRATALAAVVLVAGLPTTIIDAYNTQDVTNRGLSPRGEFHWTMVVRRLELEALDWIRTKTPPDAVVQAEPVVRGFEAWSLIPTFGERRMASGVPLPLLPMPEYEFNNQRVKRIYAEESAQLAWQGANDLGIDYLYVGTAERAAYPAVSKFDSHPELFSPVFTNDEARIYAVRR